MHLVKYNKKRTVLAVVQRHACDASLVTALEYVNSQVLNIGRKTRMVLPGLYPQFGLKNVSTETCLEIERQNETPGLEIDPETAVTAWQREVMDYWMGMEDLFRLSS